MNDIYDFEQDFLAALTAVMKNPDRSWESSCVICFIWLKLDSESLGSLRLKLPDLLKCGAEFVWYFIVCVHRDKVIDTAALLWFLQRYWSEGYKGDMVFRDLNLPDSLFVIGVCWFFNLPIGVFDLQEIILPVT